MQQTGGMALDVPISVADIKPGPVHMRRRAKTSRVVPAESELALARSWLGSSKKPLMIAGLDALKDDASASIKRFCERQNVPVITTYKAKGILPEDHPLCLGGGRIVAP